MGMKSTATKNKWNAENYDRVSLTVNKGTKQKLQEAAAEKGESINGYIKTAVQARFKADTGEDIEL
ncbi:MAG: hypothetical protein IKK53_02345 [Ruminiclostridium sp.]|nr:hypothetical protein [Ruminiclostridium sp.]